MKKREYLVIDVESIGLLGDPFAVGGVVIDEEGRELRTFSFAVPSYSVHGSPADREWVNNNIPTIYADCVSLLDMLHKFALKVRQYQKDAHEQGVQLLIAADVAFPVEARFLLRVKAEIQDFELPYPLVEISSILLAAGMDPLATYPRLENEPKHHPLGDARQSARLMIQALKMLKLRTAPVDEVEPSVEIPLREVSVRPGPDWCPMETAPRDGRPVWVRGDNFGKPAEGEHRSWAYWNGEAWQEAVAHTDNPSILQFLTHWLPSPTIQVSAPDPIHWNPYNKVVQDHRDGTIDDGLTNVERAKRGLPVPWTPEIGETEVVQPPIE